MRRGFENSTDTNHLTAKLPLAVVLGVGASIALSGCASAHNVESTPSATTEAPTSIPWPPKAGADCDASKLPAFHAAPAEPSKYVFDLRDGCTDNGVNVYHDSRSTGVIAHLPSAENFSLQCATTDGANPIAKVKAEYPKEAIGIVHLSQAAVQSVLALEAAPQACLSSM